MRKNFTADIKAASPAMKYITKEPEPVTNTAGSMGSTKSKRINLLFTPELKEIVKQAAQRRGMSMNALICDILEGALK